MLRWQAFSDDYKMGMYVERMIVLANEFLTDGLAWNWGNTSSNKLWSHKNQIEIEETCNDSNLTNYDESPIH